MLVHASWKKEINISKEFKFVNCPKVYAYFFHSKSMCRILSEWLLNTQDNILKGVSGSYRAH